MDVPRGPNWAASEHASSYKISPVIYGAVRMWSTHTDTVGDTHAARPEHVGPGAAPPPPAAAAAAGCSGWDTLLLLYLFPAVGFSRQDERALTSGDSTLVFQN